MHDVAVEASFKKLHSVSFVCVCISQLKTEWTELEIIDLLNDGSGLGFGIIGNKSTGVVVRTILAGGAADRDQRLCAGDHIFHIGDVNVRGMTSEQVAGVLRQSGEQVKLLVGRPLQNPETDAVSPGVGRCAQTVATYELDRQIQSIADTMFTGNDLTDVNELLLMPTAANLLSEASPAISNGFMEVTPLQAVGPTRHR